MAELSIPVFDRDEIDGNWPSSFGYTQTETCDAVRAQAENNLDKFAEELYYQLYPEMPRIGVDDIDGDDIRSLGYTNRDTCREIINGIEALKEKYSTGYYD